MSVDINAEVEWKQNASTWKLRYPTLDAQAQFFLIKFAKTEGVTHDKVYTLLEQFKQFDGHQQGELEEDEALRLLEARKETKTARELRTMVADIDFDSNRKLSFLEWSCCVFKMKWSDLHSPSGDPTAVAQLKELNEKMAQWKLQASARAAALTEEEAASLDKKRRAEEEKRSAEEKQRLVAQEHASISAENEAKQRKEEETRAAALSQSGVKGAAAKFHFVAADTGDSTASNAERIKAEAAARRAKAQAEADAKRAKDEHAKAEADAQRTGEEKARAEQEAAEAAARFSEAEKAKLLALKAAEEQAAFAAAKATAEAEGRAKAEAEAKAKADSQARLLAKAKLFEKQ